MTSYLHTMPILLQRVTSLRRHARANAPAASYWLRRVLDEGGRRDQTSLSSKAAGSEACDAPLPCSAV